MNANLHEELDSTLLILKYRLKANENRPEIKIIKDYGDLPEVECFPGQLNQVFMNILANAIDALEESNARRTDQETQAHPNQITIRTSLIKPPVLGGPVLSGIAATNANLCWVEVSIADNGSGMPQEVQQRIFDPFFTTKPIGQGTGMGMSISYQIITEKHSGKLECYSKAGKGTEFIIRLPLRQHIFNPIDHLAS